MKTWKKTKDRIYIALRNHRRQLDQFNGAWLKPLNVARREQIDSIDRHVEGITFRARQVQFRLSQMLAEIEENR